MDPITEDNGVQKHILLEGSGEPPPLGSLVEVHYQGKLENGKEFDSSYSRGKAFSFTLGSGAVLRGFELAIRSMQVGEKSVFALKPEYALGSKALGKIPANSSLTFEIELINFKIQQRDKTDLELSEKIERAKELKEEGNTQVKAGNWKKAKYEYYLEALTYVEDELEDDKSELQTLKSNIYSNLAICEVKLNELIEAIEHCNLVLSNDPSNLKVLYRRATARMQQGLLAEAKEDIENALKLDQNSKEFKALESLLVQKIKKYAAEEKKRYKGMFNKISIYKEKHHFHVFFDIQSQTQFRIVIEVFADSVPKLAGHLRHLCTNAEYNGLLFDKLINNKMIQVGEISEDHEDERSKVTHKQPGTVSMANSNSSLIVITFREAPENDGKFVVVGKIVEGLNEFLALENEATDDSSRPLNDIKIINSGLFD